MSFAPTHRNPFEPQPEVCDLCGNEVGGARLVQSEIEGLRGYFICDTEMCRQFRSSLTYQDRRRMSHREQSYIAQSRVFPAGASSKFDSET
jgi:hypothetical protein